MRTESNGKKSTVMMKRRLITGMLVCAGALSAFGVETQIITDDSFSQFNQGVSTGTELLAQGRLKIGPKPVELERSGEGVTWSVAVDRYDGSVFYATGHNGKVFRVGKNGKPELWADLSEVQALSLAIDPKGGLLIGASPGGKIYRVVKQGKPELFFDTKESHVWKLIFDRDGMLYAATGTNGKIFRIRGEKNGEMIFNSDATNIMDLNFDKNGNLLASTQGKGYVLRVKDAKDSYVLYAASADEVRALAVDNSGNIYAAANSSRMSSVFDKRTTGSAEFGSGLGGSASLIQIQPSGFATEFWKSPEAPINAVLSDPETSSILVAAGKNGKLYKVSTVDANYSVVADVDDSLILSLASFGDKKYFGTASKAALYELDTTGSLRKAEFASRALEAKSTVQWGNLYYDAEISSGTGIKFETRSGNTSAPSDGNWSEWIEAEPVGDRIVKTKSPVAKYLQYKVTLTSDNSNVSPELDRVRVYYVEQNAAPILKKVEITKASSAAAAQAALLAARSSSPSSSSTPSGSDDANKSSSSSSASGSSSTTSRYKALLENTQKVVIAWEADDPNGDQLRYRLLFKGEDETQWKLIEENLTTNRYVFSTEAIPDGKYRVKVEASDASQNEESSAENVELISQIYIVDNAPPEIESLEGKRVGANEFEITAKVKDSTSIISAAEYNLDASKEWRALSPEDGIFDFREESFRVKIKPEKESAEHTFSLRVYDQEGNSRVGKVILR